MTYKWDEETEFKFKQLDNGARRKVREGLNEGLAMRVEAGVLQTKVDEMKADANNMIKAAMLMGDIKSAKVDDIGTLSLKVNAPRETLDKGRLKIYLVEAGVDDGIVTKCFKKATKVTEPSEPESVAFLAARKES